MKSVKMNMNFPLERFCSYRTRRFSVLQTSVKLVDHP